MEVQAKAGLVYIVALPCSYLKVFAGLHLRLSGIWGCLLRLPMELELNSLDAQQLLLRLCIHSALQP